MFLWTRPLGLKTFRNPDPLVASQLTTFFLVCVVVAGAFGAVTVSRRIFYVQAMPALMGLALAWLG